MSKYEPLRHHLNGRASEFVPMTFEQIEAVLGFPLPKSKSYPAWWSNNAQNNVMTNEWLAAGYKTEQVDVERGKLVFRRAAPTPGLDKPPRPADPQAKQPRRHPLFGWLKGMVTVAPGTDLTQPADPEWGNAIWQNQRDANEEGGR